MEIMGIWVLFIALKYLPPKSMDFNIFLTQMVSTLSVSPYEYLSCKPVFIHFQKPVPKGNAYNIIIQLISVIIL